jgi:hypothetical protein
MSYTTLHWRLYVYKYTTRETSKERHKECINGSLAKSTRKSHFWQATSSQPVQKFPTLYGTRTFITLFTTARYLSLPSARWMHPHHPILAYRNSFFTVRIPEHLAQPTSLRTTHCWLSVPDYSINSPLPSVSTRDLTHPRPEDAPCRDDRDAVRDRLGSTRLTSQLCPWALCAPTVEVVSMVLLRCTSTACTWRRMCLILRNFGNYLPIDVA